MLMSIRFIQEAIIFIASCAYSALVFPQNTLGNESFNEEQERQRIQFERSLAHAQHEAERRECYQKFVVIACQNLARQRRDDRLHDLKRQDTALRDQQRQRQAALAVQRVEAKKSAQTSLEKNNRNAEASGKQALKEERRLKKLQKRERDKLSKNQAQKKTKRVEKRQAVSAKLPSPKSMSKRSKTATSKRVKDSEKILEKENKAQAAEQKRQADYAKRRDQHQQKLERKTKPSARSLPIPKDAQ